MRVSRLEVFGFKSFMDRLVLPLEGGISGVVGPNGCGKSNIVDALRWVLGETKASALRGGLLEDVIFNGTEKLRPLGLAEVTITLRASANDFFADLISASKVSRLLSELELPPAATTTESEDSSEESETGRPHLTVIEGALSEHAQKNNDAPTEEVKEEVVAQAATPSEITSEEEVKPAVEGNEVATPPSDGEEEDVAALTRFAWLRSVSEVQVTRRLYRSGESEFFINRVACRLKDIKDFFRAIGIGARAYSIVAQGEVTRIISARPEERRTILEEAAGIVGFRDKIAAASRRLEETLTNVSRLDDVIKEVTRQVNSLRIQASRARNRQALKDQIRTLDTSLLRDTYLRFDETRAAAEKLLTEAQSKEGELDAAVHKAHAEEQEARGGLMQFDLDCDGFRSQIDSIREELGRRATERGKFSARLNELRAFCAAKKTEIKRLEEQLNTFAQREVEGKGEIEELQLKEKESLEALQALGPDSATELREISALRDGLRIKLKEKELALRDLRDKLIASQSSMESIEEQILESSPLNQLKASTGAADLSNLRHIASDTSLFSEGISVPAQYAKAVQSVLGERAKFIVSQNPEAIARYFAEHGGREKGSGIGIFRAGEAPSVERTGSTLPRVLDLITVEAQCKLAAENILSSVYVADTLDQAFEFFSSGAGHSSATVVTLGGEVVTSYSFLSLHQEGGLIQLRRRANDLKEACAVLDADHSAGAAEREALLNQIREAEERHARVLRESQERQARARELNNQLGNIRGRLQSAARLASQAGQDSVRIKQQIEEAHRRITEFGDEDLRIQEEIKKLVPEEDNRLHEELIVLKRDYDAVEKKRREGREALSVLARNVEEARRKLDAVRSDVSKANLELQKAEIERRSLIERVGSEYGEEMVRAVEAQDGPGRLDPTVRSESESELSKLRSRIAREGDVDPSSIQQFEEESARLENLTTQKNDLESAASTLKKTIERLTKTSEERFLNTFKAVSESFSRLIPRLFGGGKGSLELLDPAHPLESGVEILTRPPGKKLKSIELLSGGEKALCATALVFAMFLERPSPLFVLDEVDAPLDEANLVRFLSLIKEMSTKTQFLLITHNKNSMAVADNLVGVTQQEPGASKIISVSLQEAYSQVA